MTKWYIKWVGVLLISTTSSLGFGEESKSEHPSKAIINSPYLKEVQLGKIAAFEKHFSEAELHFLKAIEQLQDQSLPSILLGQTFMLQQKWTDAEQQFQLALKKKSSDQESANILLSLALLSENKKDWIAAKEAWSKIQAFGQSHADFSKWSSLAINHIGRIDQWLSTQKQSQVVKKRIEERQKDQDKPVTTKQK